MVCGGFPQELDSQTISKVLEMQERVVKARFAANLLASGSGSSVLLKRSPMDERFNGLKLGIGGKRILLLEIE